MRKLFLLLFILGLSNCIFAQVVGGVHQKLATFYEEERWEDCAFKSDRMVLQEKYRKDPEVFLYLAASYNKIFLMGLVDSTLLMKVPDYANAYKYALKYSVYAKKKDKKTKFYFPENNFMLEEIAITGIYYIDHYLDIKKIPKANSYMRKIMKTYKDINIYFMHGVLSAMTEDFVTFEEVVPAVFHTMDSVRPKGVENTEFMMVYGFDLYINHLITKEEPLLDSARNVANRGLRYFPGNDLLLYDLELIDNPDIERAKPVNQMKIDAMEKIALKSEIDETGDKEEDDEYDDD